MANMYYEKHPTVAHDEQEIRVKLLDKDLFFTTDAGVFSKKMVDYGSQVLLREVRIDRPGTLLDVGCGYGPLGVTLAKTYDLKVTMVDVNERALDLARKNAQRNQVAAEIFSSDGYEKVQGSFDYIVSNPPIRAGKLVVHQILEGAFAHLYPGGRLTIVIQKKQGAPSARAKMEEVFGNCTLLKKDKGYYILESVKEWEL